MSSVSASKAQVKEAIRRAFLKCSTATDETAVQLQRVAMGAIQSINEQELIRRKSSISMDVDQGVIVRVVATNSG